MVHVAIVRVQQLRCSHEPKSGPKINLMLNSKAGVQSAFERLYRLHGKDVLAYIGSRAKPPLDAYDIAQNVWDKVWRARESFKGGKFRAWVFEIARNAITDQARKLKNEVSLGEMDPAKDESQSPLDRLEADEETRALHDCLEVIGQDFAEVLRLKLVEELKEREIAGTLGIPMSTVGTRALRGRKQLRECIERRMQR